MQENINLIIVGHKLIIIPYYKRRSCHGTQIVRKGTNHICVEAHTNHLLLLGDEQNICSLVNLGFVLLLFSGFERVVCFSNFNQVVCFQGFKEIVSECNCVCY